jgi:hypothetical protein
MNGRTWRNRFAVISLAVAALTFTAFRSSATPQDPSQQSTGDPVADAARKAREQKKKDAAKPKHVYTDEDVNHSTLGSASASTGPSAASSPEAATARNPSTQGKDAGGKAPEPEESPEIRWRKQFKEAYANLDRAQKELDILQRETNKAQVQYYSDPQKALAEQYTRKDINDHDAKIAAKKKEVDQIKQRISDMEEALRKSGGDPGWAAP